MAVPVASLTFFLPVHFRGDLANSIYGIWKGLLLLCNFHRWYRTFGIGPGVPDVLTNIFAAQSDVHLGAICEGRIFHPPVFCIFTAETADGLSSAFWLPDK